MRRFFNRFSSISFIRGILSALKGFFAILAIYMLFGDNILHVTALGSSCFAALGMPKTKSSHTKNLIGSYLLAMPIGMSISYFLSRNNIPIEGFAIFLTAAITVGLTLLFLITFRVEHPPAAGIALSFVLQPWNWLTPLYLLIAIIFLSFLRYAETKIFAYIQKRQMQSPHP